MGRRLAAAWLAAIAAGCGRGGAPAPAPEPAAGEFSVASYNLRHYSLEDRDGDGVRAEPKPAAERRAAVELLGRWKPDVLAVQEIGGTDVLDEFRCALRGVDLEYPHVEHILQPGSPVGLAVLSRFPIVARRPKTNDTYRIGDAELPVLRGFIDVDIEAPGRYRFRLFVAHLKSKVYHPRGQTEMRRNEARLLAQHVQQALRDQPAANVLVVGDLNDSPDSAPVQKLLGEETARLFDLRPIDAVGDAWTHHSRTVDVYSRIDYALASASMVPAFVRGKSCVIRDPAAPVASDHRPLFLVFRARGRDP